MADNTIISQGSFISTGAAKILTLRQDVDWMNVYNYTEANFAPGAGTVSRGVQYYWQRGMAANDGFVTVRNTTASVNTIQATTLTTSAALAVPGFTLYDNSVNTPGILTATTTFTNATPPVVTTASTAALTTGDVVRIINETGAHQVDGYDFSITVLSGTTFSLTYATNVVMAGAAGTAGFYRRIPNNPIFYPAKRRIVAISQAASAVVTVSVAHTYLPGQLIKFQIPSSFGMIQLDGLTGTITAVTAGTFTVNIDTTGFTAFAFPASAVAAAIAITPAQALPFGESAVQTYANLLDDAVVNLGAIGMQLGAGITSPAGSTSDVIYWTAGKSFSNN